MNTVLILIPLSCVNLNIYQKTNFTRYFLKFNIRIVVFRMQSILYYSQLFFKVNILCTMLILRERFLNTLSTFK